jgi:hypothetical protein
VAAQERHPCRDRQREPSIRLCFSAHLREILMSLGPIAARNPAWLDADEPERVPLST